MTKRSEYYELIILRYLQNDLSEDETLELLKWISQDNANFKLFIHTKEIWEAQNPTSLDNNEINEQYQRFLNRIEPEKSRYTRTVFLKMAKVAAVFIVALCCSWFLFEYLHSSSSEITYQTIQVHKGGISTYYLPDGSKVVLNAGSQMKIPSDFENKKREVLLDGEAYFEVAHNKEKPFIVSTDKINIRVLGTKFNLYSYADESTIETSLLEGSVRIEGKRSSTNGAVLKPGEIAIFQKTDHTLEIKKSDVASRLSWQSGNFEFKELAFEQLVSRLENWYNVKIKYQEFDFEKRNYTGVIKKDKDIYHALKLINATTPIEYNVSEGLVTITLK